MKKGKCFSKQHKKEYPTYGHLIMLEARDGSDAITLCETCYKRIYEKVTLPE